MDNSEIRRKVKYLLSFGNSKSEVYSELSGPGVKDSKLAFAIASYPDPALCERHKNMVRALAALLVVETVTWLALLVDSIIETGVSRGETITGFIALLPLFFAWSFYQPVGLQYSGYIIIALCYTSMQLLLGFKLDMVSVIWGLGTGVYVLQAIVMQFIPGSASKFIGLTLAALQIGFVWYVRHKLFPELGFFGAKKTQGRYVFSS